VFSGSDMFRVLTEEGLLQIHHAFIYEQAAHRFEIDINSKTYSLNNGK